MRVALVLLVLATTAQARPKIGLALGGGGARGCAHIGVIRALEEQNIPIDYIAGTSMGAVVGGLYASGMTTDEVEHALTTTDWTDALSDRTRYRDLAFRRKEDESRYLTALDAGIRRGKVLLPGGLRSGQKLRFLLQTYLIPVAGTSDFAKLPVPFKAVAADIETGEAVILDHGDLAQSIRASISIPGVFSPAEIDDRLLVDGGIANNVPVDVVRAMGADIVIAIDVGSPLLKREQLGSLIAVSGQVLTILTRQNVQRQLAAADFVITPPVQRYATMAFDDAAAIVDIGTRHGREETKRLAHLSVGPEEYAQLIAARPQRDLTNRPIDYLGTEGSRRVDNRIVRRRVRTRPGKPIEGETLRRDVARLYGLDDFQEVTFSVREEGGARGLILNLKDKPWGPTYVRFGINLSDDLKGMSSYDVVMSVTKTRMNALGGEWRTDFNLGRELGVVSEFYQPLDFGGRFFVAPSIQLTRSTFSLFEEERRIALLEVGNRNVATDVGAQFGESGELRVGLFRGRIRGRVSAGDDVVLATDHVDAGGLRASLSIIRVDAPMFPRTGSVLVVQYLNTNRRLGATDDYSKLSFDGYKAFSRGKYTLLMGGAGGTNLGTDLPFYDEFRLGGMLNLSAFAEGQLHGEVFGLMRAGAVRRIRKLPSTIGGSLYAGVVAEAGNVWLDVDDASFDDLHESLAFFVGGDTILGPMILAWARAMEGQNRFYVTIGKTF